MPQRYLDDDPLLADVDSLLTPHSTPQTSDPLLSEIDRLLTPSAPVPGPRVPKPGDRPGVTTRTTTLQPFAPVASHETPRRTGVDPMGVIARPAMPADIDRQRAWSESPDRDRVAARMKQPPVNTLPDPLKPPPVTLGQFNIKTGRENPPLPDVVPILESPEVGLRQIWEALKHFPLRENIRRTIDSVRAGTIPTPSPQTQNALSDVIEGTLKTAEPLMVAGAALAPIPTAVAVGSGMVAQRGTEKVAELAGAPPETSRLAGNVAGLGVGGGLTHRILTKGRQVARNVVGKLQEDYRAVQQKAGPPDPPRPTEPIPVGRGSTRPTERGAPVSPVPPEVSGKLDTVSGKVPEVSGKDPLIAEVDAIIGEGPKIGLPPARGEAAAAQQGIIDTLNEAGLLVKASEGPRVDLEGKTSPTSPIASPASNAPAEPAVSAPAPPNLHERREMGRIAAELENIQFTKRGFVEAGAGRGGDLEVVPGAAGAPVYDDILQASPGTSKYSRGEMATAIRKYLETGKLTNPARGAIEVAKARLSGKYELSGRPLSKPTLDPDAGNEPGKLYVPRTRELRPEQGAVRTRAAEQVENDPEGIVTAYLERYKNRIGSDLAKEMFGPDFTGREVRTVNSPALHEPSQVIAQAAYERLVKQPTPEGRDPVVVMTMGGTGSGKSSSLDLVMPNASEWAHAVYDSTVPSVKNIDLAVEHGKQVAIVFTKADVIDAFAHRVLPRAMEDGRTVSIPSHVRTHQQALDTIRTLMERYPEGDPNVHITIVDNTGAKGDAKVIARDALKDIRYNVDDVSATLREVLERERAAGRISPLVHEYSQAPAVSELRKPHGAGDQRVGQPQRREPKDGAPPDVQQAGGDAPARSPKPEVGGSSGGGNTRSASVRPPKLNPIPGLKSDKQLRPSEIVKLLSKRLNDLPVRVGKFRQHALGIYKIKEQVVRLKVANDLDVLAHEIGHHIDEALIGIRSPQVNLELERLGMPTSRSSYTKKQKRMEGAAEFVRHYLSDPAALKTKAPNYLAAFETALAGEPNLKQLLLEARRQYQGHLALDPKDRVLSHIDFSGVSDPTKGQTDLITALETRWIDDLAPIRVAVQSMADGKPIDILEDGYRLARLARGAPAKADGFLRFGPRAKDGTLLGPSLEKALEPVKDRLKDFVAYIVSSHVPEREGKGKATGIDLKDAAATVKALDSPEFRKARDGVRSYENALLEYLRQGGLHSDKSIKAIKDAYQHHVPLHRVQEALEGHLSGAGIASRIANRRSPLKRAHGSGADIINPLESLVRLTHAIVDTVEKQRAIGALIRQAEKTTGGGAFFEKIPTPQELQKVNLASLTREIGTALKDAGLNVGTVMGPDGPMLEVEGAPIDLDEIVKVFTPVNFVRGEKGVITYIKNGEPVFYQVNNLALYDAITAIGGKQSELLVNLFMRPARALRAGATLTLGFIGRNPVRDSFSAAVNSQYGFKPGYDFVRGLFEFLKKGDDYQQFLNSGGANSAMVAMDRNRIREELRRMNLADRRKFADSLVLNPMNLLRALSEAGENATRLGEFMRGVKKEGRTPSGLAKAGLAARDVTIDFARGGSASKEINRYTAFFNAWVQGNARIAEVFSKDPIGATMRAVTAVMLPTLALWYLNRNDEEYRELPAWEKQTYWHIPMGKGKGFARVPTPFSLFTVFGAVPHAALDRLYKNDKAVANQLFPDEHSAWDLILSVMPTAILPPVEVATNYDTFRKRAIVSPWDLGLDKELQYNRWTSDLAKAVGPKIGLAPAKFDHLIYGYFAGLGRTAVSTIDLAGRAFTGDGPAKPSRGLTGLPVVGEAVGAFSRSPAGSDAQSIQEVYELRDALTGAKDSVARLRAKGETAKAQARVADVVKAHGDPDAALDRVTTATKALGEQRKTLDQVWAHETLTPDEKRELQNRIFEQMVNTARRAMGRDTLPSRYAKPPSEELLEKFSGKRSAMAPLRRAQ